MPVDFVSVIPLALILLGAGVCAGVIAGLLGVGGGIVIVPLLFHVFGEYGIDPAVKMHLAVGTSLASIILTSASSLRAHFKRGAVDQALLWAWGPAVALGVLAGSALAAHTRGSVLTGFFAVFALTVAAYMLLTNEDTRVSDHLPSLGFQRVIAFLIGGFSAMLGIGGGTFTVPTLVLCSYPIRRAVATASAIGAVIALPGTIGFMVSGLEVAGRPPLSLGYVSLLGLILLGPTSMLAAPWGAHLAHSISPRYLRYAFSGFLGLTSVRMFYGLLH